MDFTPIIAQVWGTLGWFIPLMLLIGLLKTSQPAFYPKANEAHFAKLNANSLRAPVFEMNRLSI